MRIQKQLDENESGKNVISTWKPFPGPQTTLFETTANEVFFGGSAGGGKTAAIVGLSLTRHQRSLILRREASQLNELVDQLKQFAPKGSHWRGIGNGGRMTTPDGRIIELAGVPHEDDKRRFQGRPHSLKAFDECTEFSESMIDYISAWNRSTLDGQKCLRLLTGNPPTHSGGGWIISRYARWIDPTAGNKARPGVPLFFVRLGDKEEECADGTPILFKGINYVPQSRTFIPARLADNPLLSKTDYASRLVNLPPAMRDAFLYGDFSACLSDDPWQVIPTPWIVAAQKRWMDQLKPETKITKCGLDIAYGGSDKTVLAIRRDNWVDTLICWKGEETDSGKKAAALVKPCLEGSLAPVNVDVIGYGSSCYEFLKEIQVKSEPVNFGKSALNQTDRRAVLSFSNIRALCYWRLRDMLDPDLGYNLALPPDPSGHLIADLSAPRYEWRSGKIHMKSKEEIAVDLGRSPDMGDAVALSCYEPPKTSFIVESW